MSETIAMSATSVGDPKHGSRTRQEQDERMEQVRELLFGEYERQIEERVGVLETRFRDLELSIHRRLDAMQASLDALSAELDATQRKTLDEIGSGLREIGERIKRVSLE